MTAPRTDAAVSGPDQADTVDVAAGIDDARLTAVSYRPDLDTEPQQVSLTTAARIQYEDAAPIRQPMAYQGQWSKPGYYLMARTGQLVSYESRFEMAHLTLVDRDPTVVAIAPQPFRIHWCDNSGRVRRHVPDFFVRRADGACEVIDVKGSRRAERPENALVFGVTARACGEMRMHFRVAGDIDPVALDNERWLAGYRFAIEGVADLGPYLIDAAQSRRSLARIVTAAAEASHAHSTDVKRVLFHLLWAGIVQCDLTTPLAGDTVIYPKPEAVGHVG